VVDRAHDLEDSPPTIVTTIFDQNIPPLRRIAALHPHGGLPTRQNHTEVSCRGFNLCMVVEVCWGDY